MKEKAALPVMMVKEVMGKEVFDVLTRYGILAFTSPCEKIEKRIWWNSIPDEYRQKFSQELRMTMEMAVASSKTRTSSRNRTKMRPITVEPNELLRVMTRMQFNDLFTRGEFDIIQSYRHCSILLESVPQRFILDLAERQGCSNEKSQLLFSAVPLGSADLRRKGCTKFQPIAVVYRRVERLPLYQRNPHQVGVLLSVDEYEKFDKTQIGRLYISSFRWEKCSLQVARV